MSTGPIRPSTLDGIKRYAKTLKADQGLQHAEALDAAAVAGGFNNYTHARRQLGDGAKPPPGFLAYITVSWRVRETKEKGQETLAVSLATPLDQLVKPPYLKSARHFGAFRFGAPDHLTHDLLASSQSDARRRVCAAARTLAFMEATGLRPSAGRSRAYPRGSISNAVPGKDHYSEWFDPAAKAYVFVDEPYSRAAEHVSQERLAWARKHGWEMVRTRWAGMYNPDGGCELYLAADKAKGYSLAPILAILDALPPPMIEANWNGESTPAFPPFISPASLTRAAAPKADPKPRTKRSANATTGYRTLLSRSERRRPSKRMPIEAHAEVGRLLKSVIAKSYARQGVYNRLNAVRSDLDDWVQCEYNREELPSEVFFDLYYHEDQDAVGTRLSGPALKDRHIANLERAKQVLAQHYPDCEPRRALFKSTDAAIKSLQAWAA